MHRYTRLLFTALAAAAVMATAVGGASARNLSVSNQNFRAVWARLELSNTLNSTTVRCQVTLEGSFHSRTIVKRFGALLGHVTRADLGPCTSGTATIVQASLPWHVTYEGFTGTLPNIRTLLVLLTGVHFFINAGGTTCEARTEPRENASGIIPLTGGVAESLDADPSRSIVLRGGPFGACGLGRGIFRGSAALTLLNSTTRITVRLI